MRRTSKDGGHLLTDRSVLDTSGDKTVDFGDGHSVEMEDGIGDAVTHATNMHEAAHGRMSKAAVFRKLDGIFKSLRKLPKGS